jgi:predicted nucleic acid-binding protein
MLYAESSAVLTWLFDEPRAPDAIRELENAASIVTSELTRIECARAIHRAASLGALDRKQVAMLLGQLDAATSQWDRVELRDRVAELASMVFPVEPVRALDAIHLASALLAREAWEEVAVLSFDERVRSNAIALGFAVVPAAS